MNTNLWLVQTINTDLWLVDKIITDLWLVQTIITDLWLVDTIITDLWLVAGWEFPEGTCTGLLEKPSDPVSDGLESSAGKDQQPDPRISVDHHQDTAVKVGIYPFV